MDTESVPTDPPPPYTPTEGTNLIKAKTALAPPPAPAQEYGKPIWSIAIPLVLRVVAVGTTIGGFTYLAIQYGALPKAPFNAKLFSSLIGLGTSLGTALTSAISIYVNKECRKSPFAKEVDPQETESAYIKIAKLMRPSRVTLFPLMSGVVGTTTMVFVYAAAQRKELPTGSFNSAQVAAISGLSAFTISLGTMIIYYSAPALCCCSSALRKKITALLKLFAMSGYVAVVMGGAHYYFGSLLTPGQLSALVTASTFIGSAVIIFVSNTALATPIQVFCPPGLFSISQPFKKKVV